MKNKKGFTLVELVTVLVVLAIIALIAIPLVLTLIKNTEISANKRSVDAYGKSVEMAVMLYLGKEGDYPTDLYSLKPQYTGKDVKCNIMYLNKDGSLYLSQCSVDGVEVKSEKEFDGYYHYGKVPDAKESKAVSTILAKANDKSVKSYELNSAASHELYTFEQPETDQTDALIDYRYIGSDPYNYVIFNDELWRIIGVFPVENAVGQTVRRIKLIRNDFIGRFMLDGNPNIDYNKEEYWGVCDGSNDWSKSYLNKYLNEEYYSKLSANSKDMIEEAKYYLGGVRIMHNMGANHYYKWERGKKIYKDNSSKEWSGNIGLMYPSDYIYTYAYGVDAVCFKYNGSCGDWYWDEENEIEIESNKLAGWLYVPDDDEDYYPQWTISHLLDSNSTMVRISNHAFIEESCTVEDEHVRPTVYLNSSVEIIEGDGSLANPYKLSTN